MQQEFCINQEYGGLGREDDSRGKEGEGGGRFFHMKSHARLRNDA